MLRIGIGPLRVALLAVVTSLAGWSAARGQENRAAVPAPSDNAGGGGGGGAVIIEESTSGLYFEWIVVAAVVGAAVYTVCRSSRRN